LGVSEYTPALSIVTSSLTQDMQINSE
jgi:hypothetical protein